MLAKIESRLANVQGKHMSLAARITVASGLILSSLWYVITLWPGDIGFFNVIQKKLEALSRPVDPEWIKTPSAKENLTEGWVC